MKARIFIGKEATGKTRVAKMISEYIGKDKTVTLCGGHSQMKSRFAFSDLNENTQLLIIDDCPANFDFEKFFHVIDDRQNGGDLKFSILVEKQGKEPKEIQIPYIIFTTNYLSEKWSKLGASFRELFDIVEFPLSAPFL